MENLVYMESPLTGKLELYRKHLFLDAAEAHSTLDTIWFRDQLNSDIISQGVDAVCTEVRHYETDIIDYVEVEFFVPELVARAGAEKKSLVAVTIFVVVGLIIALIMATAIAIVTVTNALHRQKMDAAYPDLFYVIDPNTGDLLGPMPRESAVTLKEALYPGMWIDPTTTLMVDPNSPDAVTKIAYIINNTPAGWGEPTEYPDDWMNKIMMLLIVGGVIIGGIMVLPHVLRAFRKPKQLE